MSLICSLLGHKPDPARVMWNQDICFGKCARCGCDLVRSGDAPWQVPRGYRVVWRAPEKQVACIEAEAAEPVAVELASGLEGAVVEQATTAPEEEPLEELRDEMTSASETVEWPLVASPPAELETGEEPAAEPAAVAEEPAREEVRSAAPDFMDVEEEDFDWDDVPIRQRRAAHA